MADLSADYVDPKQKEVTHRCA